MHFRDILLMTGVCLLPPTNLLTFYAFECLEWTRISLKENFPEVFKDCTDFPQRQTRCNTEAFLDFLSMNDK